MAGAKCAGGSRGPDPARPGGHSQRSGLDLKGLREPLQVEQRHAGVRFAFQMFLLLAGGAEWTWGDEQGGRHCLGKG